MVEQVKTTLCNFFTCDKDPHHVNFIVNVLQSNRPPWLDECGESFRVGQDKKSIKKLSPSFNQSHENRRHLRSKQSTWFPNTNVGPRTIRMVYTKTSRYPAVQTISEKSVRHQHLLKVLDPVSCGKPKISDVDFLKENWRNNITSLINFDDNMIGGWSQNGVFNRFFLTQTLRQYFKTPLLQFD
jgi:hypothetical protein